MHEGAGLPDGRGRGRARLCSADEADFWRTIADGIVVSGVRQSHTEDEPALQGLLPDFEGTSPFRCREDRRSRADSAAVIEMAGGTAGRGCPTLPRWGCHNCKISFWRFAVMA